MISVLGRSVPLREVMAISLALAVLGALIVLPPLFNSSDAQSPAPSQVTDDPMVVIDELAKKPVAPLVGPKRYDDGIQVEQGAVRESELHAGNVRAPAPVMHAAPNVAPAAPAPQAHATAPARTPVYYYAPPQRTYYQPRYYAPPRYQPPVYRGYRSR